MFTRPNGQDAGNGQMLEAPYTGSVVKISPVRTSGMTPFVTRMVEW